MATTYVMDTSAHTHTRCSPSYNSTRTSPPQLHATRCVVPSSAARAARPARPAGPSGAPGMTTGRAPLPPPPARPGAPAPPPPHLAPPPDAALRPPRPAPSRAGAQGRRTRPQHAPLCDDVARSGASRVCCGWWVEDRLRRMPGTM